MTQGDTQLSVVQLRKQGNTAYKAGRFDGAIKLYEQAISYRQTSTKSSEISTLHSNKSMCYFHLKKYNDALFEIQLAIKQYRHNVKAWFYKGQCHYALEQYVEAISAFQQTTRIAAEHNYNVSDDIGSVLRQAQRAKFEADEKLRLQNISELKQILSRLKTVDGGEATVSAADRGRLVELLDIVKKYETRPVPPDALYGKISFDIMKDPVITPSGASYEREHIMEHLGRRGHFDPMTLQPLKPQQLIANYGLKEMIDDFIEHNPWVLEE